MTTANWTEQEWQRFNAYGPCATCGQPLGPVVTATADETFVRVGCLIDDAHGQYVAIPDVSGWDESDTPEGD